MSPSLLPTPEPADPVEGATGHFEHTNWVKQSLKNLDQGTVHSAAGSVSGGLTVDKLSVDDSASQAATIDLVGAGPRSIWGKTAAGTARWLLNMGDAATEGGANSGSVFGLFAYRDDGSLSKNVLVADRNSGLVKVAGPPTEAQGIATKEYVDNSMPIGAIIAYGGSAAPAGWHICNGTSHGSSALQAIIGSATTPDLSGRFIVGAGTGYDPKTTGGVAQNTLTAAQTATKGHTHTATSAAEAQEHQHLIDPPLTWSSGHNQNHTHSGTTGAVDRAATHGHNFNMTEGTAEAGEDGIYLDTTQSSQGYVRSNSQSNISVWLDQTNTNHLHAFATGGASVDHQHSVDIVPFWSGGRSATHTHVIAVTPTTDANATTPIENRPPYYALIYIIRKA